MDIDVEQVVREVFRRLESGPGSSAPRPSVAESNVQNPARRTLQLPGKVITLADVEDRLEGIDSLQTARGAVITPSARDYLRQQNVGLASTAAVGGGPVELLLASVGPLDSGPLSTALAKQGIRHELLHSESSTMAVQTLLQRMNRQTVAALLTNRAAAAACLANRHQTFRAAVVRNTDEVEESLAAIGMNLAVIDPTGKGTYGVLQLLREFVATGVQTPSAEFQAALT